MLKRNYSNMVRSFLAWWIGAFMAYIYLLGATDISLVLLTGLLIAFFAFEVVIHRNA